MRPRIFVVALTVLAAASAHAVDLSLSTRAIEEAIDAGQSRIESYRRRFQAPYHLVVARPPVDYIEVVTPFRRVALAAETRARIGDRSFAQREALQTLAEAPQQIDLLIELTFNPMNTFVGVPAYEVQVVAPGARPSPESAVAVERFARFGVRTDPAGLTLPYPYVFGTRLPDGSEPLLGGTLLVHLDGNAVAKGGLYDVLVIDARQELSRTRVDFRALR